MPSSLTFTASAALYTALEGADKTYRVHRALAKRLFNKNVQAQRELLLGERRPEARAEWLQQANIFYTRLRDNAWGQARVWLVTLLAVARFALEDQPQ